MNKFKWYNKNITIMSIVCFLVWLLTGTEVYQALYGTSAVYLLCIALYNLRDSGE